MVDDQLLISELAERAGVSVRTIRYYISEGLLPSPEAHGRYSMYDEEYLTRIELIKLLKNAYLPLKEIRRLVESLSTEEIESMLNKLSEPSSRPVTSSPQPQAPEPPASAPPAHPSQRRAEVREGGLPEALDYISRVLHSQAAPANRANLPIPLAQAAPLGQPKAGRRDLRDVSPGNGAIPPDEGESSWRRYTIQAGVELLVSEQVYNQSAPLVHRIVAQVKQLFSVISSGGKKNV